MKNLKYFVLIYILLISFSRCAKRATLSGGPKDTQPPRLKENIKTTPNFQINFNPKIIKLYFDEWISLKNKNQILISPIIKKKPEINYLGKHIIIKFDPTDTLKRNTTYIINFGNSIVDFTEGNPIKNFSYIFSTGDKIDSLKIRGIVTNAYDNKHVKGVKVMLYKENKDSVVFNKLPYYYTQTDDNGMFEIPYMHEGKYKVFVLKEKNNNYFFDSEEEEIGFLDTMLVVGDTIVKQIGIKLFKPLPDLSIVEKAVTGYGKIKIKYNRAPNNFRILKSNVKILDEEQREDSLLIWYDMVENKDSISLILQDEIFVDTLVFKIRKPYKHPISVLLDKKELKNKFYPEFSPFLFFNQPVKVSDTLNGKLIIKDSIYYAVDSFPHYIKDSLYNKIKFTLQRDTIEKRKVYIMFKENEGQNYSFILYPGTIKGLFGQTNDTIEFDFGYGRKENYSNLTIHLDSLNDKKSYIVLLKKHKTINKRIIEGHKRLDLDYKGLIPGKYSLEIIEDDNLNRRWDGGDYFKKKGAEKIYRFKLNDLKKNWDQEENIILRNNKTNDTKNRKP